jgi:hypothetical protein
MLIAAPFLSVSILHLINRILLLQKAITQNEQQKGDADFSKSFVHIPSPRNVQNDPTNSALQIRIAQSSIASTINITFRLIS